MNIEFEKISKKSKIQKITRKRMSTNTPKELLDMQTHHVSAIKPVISNDGIDLDISSGYQDHDFDSIFILL